MNTLFWVTTNAMITKKSGDRTNVGFIVRAPYADVFSLIGALNSGRIVPVERLETRAVAINVRRIIDSSSYGLAATGVSSIALYNGTVEN